MISMLVVSGMRALRASMTGFIVAQAVSSAFSCPLTATVAALPALTVSQTWKAAPVAAVHTAGFPSFALGVAFLGSRCVNALLVSSLMSCFDMPGKSARKLLTAAVCAAGSVKDQISCMFVSRANCSMRSLAFSNSVAVGRCWLKNFECVIAGARAAVDVAVT